MIVELAASEAVTGDLRVPGDKSIGHRALLFGALATGTTRARNVPGGADVQATRRCLEALGVAIVDEADGILAIDGIGTQGFVLPSAPLDCANSGTTMRLLAAILASYGVTATLDGDASLRKRPMRRIATPLRSMGARVDLAAGDTAPLRVSATTPLRAIDYTLPVASAQLKTAVLLAGLRAQGRTVVRGPIGSRDHTERLLPAFGAALTRNGDALVIDGGQRLRATTIDVPGDPSSAAFWIAAAAIRPGSRVTIRDVSLNPTRLGFVDVLRRMGAQITTHIEVAEPEPRGTVSVIAAPLRATEVGASEVPAIIDELPLLGVVAAFAMGTTIVRGAEELRVKESDRIATFAQNAQAMGMAVETFPDGFAVHGGAPLHAATIAPHHDHRIAMAFAIAALGASGTTRLADAEVADVSYPGFFTTLAALRGR